VPWTFAALKLFIAPTVDPALKINAVGIDCGFLDLAMIESHVD